MLFMTIAIFSDMVLFFHGLKKAVFVYLAYRESGLGKMLPEHFILLAEK